MVRLNGTYSLRFLAAAMLLASCGFVSPLAAAELTIAMQGAQTAVDPHWMTSPRNWTVNHHIFEPMVRRDNTTGTPEPWLASSWKRLDDVTWDFYLRKDVKWHDGSPFTADDVVFTYDRAGRVPNAPSPFLGYIKYFEKVEAKDAHTVRITTKGPAPALLHDIAYLLIVSKKHGGAATTEDYNAGKAATGTGAYKLVQFLHNDRTVLVRNPDYWGAKEPWDKVTFKMMPSDASRTAAILTGDVDVIESVPTVEIERLKNDKRVTLYTKPTGRVAYMTADAGEEALASGRLLDLNGQPLKTNPFAEKRVRQALKLAVDLEQIVKRIYQGEALATGQYLLPGVFGFNPDLKPWKADPAAARKLLEEAGWADKFKITIGSSAETFQNSVQTAQAIAQAWTRIGIQTDVVSMPYPTFLKMRNERLLPVTLMTRQNSPLIADSFFPVVTHSWGNFKGEDGMGTSNFARYSNPKVDDLIEQAMVTMDDAKREAMYREVAKIAVDDSQITPLFLLNEATATKPNLTFIPRFDRAIYAMNVRLKQ